MLCVLIGHNYINEVQTVAQVFAPGGAANSVKLHFQATQRLEVGYTVETVIGEDEAAAFVYKDGSLVSEYTWLFSEMTEFLNKRRVLMLCMYHALQRAIGVHTPWGSLTGIRPSKLVREWMDAGHQEEKILDVLTGTYCCQAEKARLAITVAHAEKRLTPPPNTIGIYVSIPFCPTRCVYCSFNTSQKPADADLQTRYSAALIGECFEKAKQAQAMGATISSIYIGGGTPTVLSENLLEKVLDAIGAAFGLLTKSDIEYTVEAGRPDTLTPEKLSLLRRYGVNRIAVNPQTLNDRTLSTIGRGHTAADFFAAFEMARDAGFASINTDLIAGLPNETTGDMQRNMEALSKLSPENITIHTLALKRASQLKENLRANPVGLLDESDIHPPVAEMLNCAADACAAMGLFPYYLYRQKNMVGLLENVGYSRPGHECLYNIGMMAEVQTILGIGAGAVSKFVDLENNKISREFNAKNPEIYIERRNFS